jgi:hypothetical protein
MRTGAGAEPLFLESGLPLAHSSARERPWRVSIGGLFAASTFERFLQMGASSGG